MHPIGYLFFGFGALLAIIGVMLFARMGTQGTSSVKMLGFEFQLGGSALVIVVVGIVLVMVPVVYGDRFFVNNRRDPQSTQSTPAAPTASRDASDAQESRARTKTGTPAPTASRNAPDGPESRPREARAMMLDIIGAVQFEKGEFKSTTDCRKRVTRLPEGREDEKCVVVPRQVFCSYLPSEPWKCFVDRNQCETMFALDKIIDGIEQTPRNAVECAATSFADARQHVLGR